MAGSQSAFKTKIAAQNWSRLQPHGSHRFFISLKAHHVRLQTGTAGDKRDPAMAEAIEILHYLLNAGNVVDLELTHVLPHWRKIEEGDCNSSAREFVNQLQADLRSHDCDAAHFVLHHSFRCFARAPGIVICVAQDCFIPELARARLEAFDDFREERVLDVGNDDAERFPRARCESARMRVRNVSQQFHRGKDESLRLLAHLAGLVQYVRNSRRRDARSLSYIEDGEALRAISWRRWQVFLIVAIQPSRDAAEYRRTKKS